MSNTDNLLRALQRKFAGNKRISTSLVTLSSAAILAIYAAGYEQTRAAADRFNEQTAERLAGAAVPNPDQSAALPLVEPDDGASPVRSIVTAVKSTSPASVNPGIASNVAIALNVTSASAPAPAENPATPTSRSVEVPPANDPVTVANEPRAVDLPASTPIPVPEPAPVARQSLYKDGTFQGWGSSRHGDIQVSVVIQDGRIASAAIAQCLTRYPCSWIAQLPGQVVSRQAPSVDYVSGATQSVNAYYSAVVEALSRAK